MMKNYILLISSLCVCATCFTQEHINKDSIQICYSKRLDAIGGQDHCVTIYFDDSLMFGKRICYSTFSDIYRYIDTTLNYQESQKQAILCHYQENNNYFILDKHVEISKSQFDELVKITNEIKAFVSESGINPDEIIISTTRSHYVIKDKSGTTIIIDWLGCYDRRRDIEKVLGLKSYLRCPCVEKDLKQKSKSRKKGF